MPYYFFHEMTHATLSPWRTLSETTRAMMNSPMNPMAATALGRSVTAGFEVFERATRQYGKPAFGIDEIEIDGVSLNVVERTVWSDTFCNLINFQRMVPAGQGPDMSGRLSKVVIVAPMSGHYATLLRGTVEGLLPYHDVYITDWIDARQVPVTEGSFDLDDYIDYIVDISHHFQGDVHFVAVCQPSVPVLAAVACMEQKEDSFAPKSMTLMGGPIDTRINPTAVNDLAQKNDLSWFENNVIMTVPFPHPGVMRRVYPGFLQLTGFMSMNLDRHMSAQREFYNHLVQGDGESADKHREFYDEYLAVMDLTAEFYLQTVDTVFIRHALATGDMKHRGEPVTPEAISKVALLTVEGEKDDISGVGQTEAAHRLCSNIPDNLRMHYVQAEVGHYGVFNGSRFRKGIRPKITEFVLNAEQAGKTTKKPSVSPDTKMITKTKVDRKKSVKQSMASSDLKKISGIGAVLEKRLAEEGISTFKDVASLSATKIEVLDKKLKLMGRIGRENWVKQAQKLDQA